VSAVKRGFVYIMASRLNGTIYVGSTSNLIQRIYQHREGLADGFTRRHGCKLLVWFEVHEELDDARLRELQIKKWKRDWKLKLIEGANPDWLDLYESLL
jgi:putative endonuclease